MYGGAAGGGKSSALLMAAAQYVDTPGYAALVLRRTFRDLNQPDAMIPRSKDWWHDEAHWNEAGKRWTFPSGATITFGYLDNADAVRQYQGSAYQCVCLDELTQFPEFPYRYLFSRLRKLTGSDVPIRMRSSSNPGGVGHEWVKKRFLPDGFFASPERYSKCWWKDGRLFVPARLEDNAHLDRVDYDRSLEELLPLERARLRNGDWSAHAGGHFREEWFATFRDNVDAWYVESTAEVARKVTCQIVCTMDPAGGVSESADYTAIVVGALTPGGTLLILDVVRDRIAVESIVPRLAEVCGRWKPQYVGIEDAFAQSAYIRWARATPGIPTVMAMDPEGKSKLVRATPAIIRAEHGGIALPREAHWREDFLGEVCGFVGDDKLDAHDDIVDSLAYLVLALDRYRTGQHRDGPTIFRSGRR